MKKVNIKIRRGFANTVPGLVIPRETGLNANTLAGSGIVFYNWHGVPVAEIWKGFDFKINGPGVLTLDAAFTKSIPDDAATYIVVVSDSRDEQFIVQEGDVDLLDIDRRIPEPEKIETIVRYETSGLEDALAKVDEMSTKLSKLEAKVASGESKTETLSASVIDTTALVAKVQAIRDTQDHILSSIAELEKMSKRIDSIESGLSASSSAVDRLSGRIDTAQRHSRNASSRAQSAVDRADQVVSKADQLENTVRVLTKSIDDLALVVKDNEDAISFVSNAVSPIRDHITSVAARLEGRIDSVSKSSLRSEAKHVDVSDIIDDLTQRVGALSSKVEAKHTDVAGTIGDLAQKISVLSSKVEAISRQLEE